MGENRTEETSKRVRDSVKDAIGKITGNAKLRSDGAVEKPVEKESTAGTGTDQTGQISLRR